MGSGIGGQVINPKTRRKKALNVTEEQLSFWEKEVKNKIVNKLNASNFKTSYSKSAPAAKH